MEYKKDISRRLGEEILLTIENFQVPDFTTKIDPPFIDGKKAGLTTFSNSFTSAVCMNPVPIPSIMDLFVSEEDYLEARNQRDEAKQFKQRICELYGRCCNELFIYQTNPLPVLPQALSD